MASDVSEVIEQDVKDESKPGFFQKAARGIKSSYNKYQETKSIQREKSNVRESREKEVYEEALGREREKQLKVKAVRVAKEQVNRPSGFAGFSQSLSQGFGGGSQQRSSRPMSVKRSKAKIVLINGKKYRSIETKRTSVPRIMKTKRYGGGLGLFGGGVTKSLNTRIPNIDLMGGSYGRTSAKLNILGNNKKKGKKTKDIMNMRLY